MSETRAHLERARAAIAKEDWAPALLELLGAWRQCRVVRLAALVDRVAERISSPPIAGKTVKARTEAWLEQAKKLQPLDLGSLLATPWPGKWQDNIGVLEALERFPEDPRIALALARRIMDTPYESGASWAFYELALRIIAKAGDLRTKPLLEEDLARAAARRWSWRRLFEEALRKLSAEDALEPEEETALLAVEALFASEVRAEATNEKSDADFLAAIYAAPEDDALRAVYADWLTERGDPRGEFITLQLTPNVSPAAKRREAALLKKHGAAWAGALDRLLMEGARVFTRGFLSGGLLSEEKPPAELAHPEWAVVESLGLVSQHHGKASTLLTAPFLRNLRSLAGIPEAAVAQMADEGLAPRLEEIRMVIANEVTPEVLEGRRRIARRFFKLKSLGAGGKTDDLVAFFTVVLPKKNLERVVVVGSQLPLAAMVNAKLDVPTLEAREWFTADGAKWKFELHRDTAGNFTRLVAGPGNPEMTLPSYGELRTVLASLPDLTELVIPRAGGAEWDRRALSAIEEVLAKCTSLRTIDVPWDREVTMADDGPRLAIGTRARTPITDDLDAIWEAVTSPPLSFELDSISVNYSGHAPLEADGLAHVKKAFAKKRTNNVLVYRKRSAETTQVRFRAEGFELTMPRGPDFDIDVWLVWLCALLDRTKVDSVAGSFFGPNENGRVQEVYGRRVGPISQPFQWLMGFGPDHAALYDLDDVATCAEAIGFRVLRTKRQLLVMTSEAPDRIPPDERRAAFDVKVTEAFWKQFERKRGFTPQKLAAKILGGELAKSGYEAVSDTSWTREGSAIVVDIGCQANGDFHLQLQFRRADGRSHLEYVHQLFLANQEKTSDALEAFLPRLTKLLPWLDAPWPVTIPKR